jgi:hypothetical protein
LTFLVLSGSCGGREGVSFVHTCANYGILNSLPSNLTAGNWMEYTRLLELSQWQ